MKKLRFLPLLLLLGGCAYSIRDRVNDATDIAIIMLLCPFLLILTVLGVQWHR